VAPWHVGLTATVLMIYVFISEMKQLLYFCVKIFFHSILSIFFREVSIIGKQNIPQYGPVIFTGNHANQFIDSVVMLSTCQRTISYLMAAKSYNRRIIGDIAWAMGAVPVKRAQDSAKPGKGTIVLEPVEGNTDEAGTKRFRIIGSASKFKSQLSEKDKIRLPGQSVALKVLSIQSDVSLEIEVPANFEVPSGSLSYDVMPHVDHNFVYEKVLSKLSSGG
jgi:glycerol-3-phosphate O-acyltransferase/dihydroxyacetone phosphate acyltransferase